MHKISTRDSSKNGSRPLSEYRDHQVENHWSNRTATLETAIVDGALRQFFPCMHSCWQQLLFKEPDLIFFWPKQETCPKCFDSFRCSSISQTTFRHHLQSLPPSNKHDALQGHLSPQIGMHRLMMSVTTTVGFSCLSLYAYREKRRRDWLSTLCSGKRNFCWKTWLYPGICFFGGGWPNQCHHLHKTLVSQ